MFFEGLIQKSDDAEGTRFVSKYLRFWGTYQRKEKSYKMLALLRATTKFPAAQGGPDHSLVIKCPCSFVEVEYLQFHPVGHRLDLVTAEIFVSFFQ